MTVFVGVGVAHKPSIRTTNNITTINVMPGPDRVSNKVTDSNEYQEGLGPLMDIASPALGDPGYFKKRNSGMTIFVGVGVAHKQ